jgi:hypothetical protein
MPTADTFGDLAAPGTDAHTISCIYAQVAGGFMLMMCLFQCPGPRGLVMGVVSLICLMFKHKYVDGSGPPPEGFAMAFAVLVACGYAGSVSMDAHESKVGTYAVTLWMLFYVGIMAVDPKGMLTGSYPDIEGDSLTVGLVWVEVMTGLALMSAMTQCPGALGRAMACSVNLALMGYHLSQGIQPPPPVMVLGTVTALLQYKDLLMPGAAAAAKKD